MSKKQQYLLPEVMCSPAEFVKIFGLCETSFDIHSNGILEQHAFNLTIPQGMM